MVSFFIVYLTIIFFSVTPIPVRIGLYMNGKTQSGGSSIRISIFRKNIEFHLKRKPKRARPKSKPRNWQLKFQFHRDIFKLFTPDLLKGVCLTTLEDAPILSNVLTYLGVKLGNIAYLLNPLIKRENVLFLPLIHPKGKFYFQSEVKFKFNLFLIFSVLFKIIKLEKRQEGEWN